MRLLGKLAGFNADLAPVAEIDGLVVYREIHLSCKIILRHPTQLGEDTKNEEGNGVIPIASPVCKFIINDANRVLKRFRGSV